MRLLQVILASIVTHAPRSKVSNVALMELKQGCNLFEKVAAHKGRPAKFLVSLRPLRRLVSLFPSPTA
jgi:hypothetical protein